MEFISTFRGMDRSPVLEELAYQKVSETVFKLVQRPLLIEVWFSFESCRFKVHVHIRGDRKDVHIIAEDESPHRVIDLATAKVARRLACLKDKRRPRRGARQGINENEQYLVNVDDEYLGDDDLN